MNYLSLINGYFEGNESGQAIYITHVTLVTQKALSIAKRLELSEDSLQFIEEASMLHDIGCCRVDFPEMNVKASLPYICHMTEGHKILEEEGLPKHARVASTHTGVGIYVEDIKKQNLPLEEKDYVPESIEEKIISYADLFFSKDPQKLFVEKTPEQIKAGLAKFGDRHVETFGQWHAEFGV